MSCSFLVHSGHVEPCAPARGHRWRNGQRQDDAGQEAAGGAGEPTDPAGHDWYYLDRSHLPAEQREAVNYDEPAALDNALLARHLAELKAARPVDCPSYDFASHTRS